MDRLVGMIAAAVACAATALFAISMLIGSAPLSWSASLVLSWGYLVLVAALLAEAPAGRRGSAFAGLGFAVMYAVFVGVVYFVQLTTVLQNGAAPDIMAQISYAELGSMMFNLDLFGYAMMAASTFFVGLALVPANASDRVLRILLLVHGAFAPACVLLPIFNVFGAMGGSAGDTVGVAVLLFWCAYFLPVTVLAFVHFRVRA